jgi:hypothetical protein
MIDLKNKGAFSALLDMIEAAGHWLYVHDGAILVSDETAVQAIIDGFDPIQPAQAAKWAGIKNERDQRSVAGVLVGAYRFHSDPGSRIQQLGLKDQARDMLAAGGAYADQLVKNGQAVQWKTMGGVFVPMTVQLAFDVVAAVGDADAKIFTAAETHRAAMLQSATPWDYDFSAGWPEV